MKIHNVIHPNFFQKALIDPLISQVKKLRLIVNTKFLIQLLLWKTPQMGKFTHSFDKVLLEKHTLALYEEKTHIEAATLYQLRSDICKLHNYLIRIGVIMVDICSCKHKAELVDHFLFRCPLRTDQRHNICKLATKFNK